MWWYDDDDDWYDDGSGGTGLCDSDEFEGRGNDRKMSSVDGNVFGGTGSGISVSGDVTTTGCGLDGNDEYPVESGVRGKELPEEDSGLDGVSSGQTISTALRS